MGGMKAGCWAGMLLQLQTREGKVGAQGEDGPARGNVCGATTDDLR